MTTTAHWRSVVGATLLASISVCACGDDDEDPVDAGVVDSPPSEDGGSDAAGDFDANEPDAGPSLNVSCESPRVIEPGTVTDDLAYATTLAGCGNAFVGAALHYEIELPIGARGVVRVEPLDGRSDYAYGILVRDACDAETCAGARSAPAAQLGVELAVSNATAAPLRLLVSVGPTVPDLLEKPSLDPTDPPVRVQGRFSLRFELRVPSYAVSSIPLDCEPLTTEGAYVQPYTGPEQLIRLTFPFRLAGSPVDRFILTNLGYLAFGSLSQPPAADVLSPPPRLPDTRSPNGILAPHWVPIPYAGSPLEFATVQQIDDPAARRLVIQLGVDEASLYQVKLFEDQHIEFHYCRLLPRPIYLGDDPPEIIGYEPISIGVESLDGRDGLDLRDVPGVGATAGGALRFVPVADGGAE